MKRALIWFGLVLALMAGGYVLFQRYWIYIPGLLNEWRSPIGPNEPVTWARGAARAAVQAPAGGDAPRPNIILIVADDLGYNDISLNGGGIAGGRVQTPNIDRLAREGVNFTNGYAANATCSPSRAAMMTGRYPTRFGFEFTAVPGRFADNVSHGNPNALRQPIYHRELNHDLIPYPEMGVPGSEITIAEVLRDVGYRTMHIGKWHLGEAPALQPNAQGFDESLALLPGAGMFLPADSPYAVNARLPWDPIDRFLWANAPYAVQWNGGHRFEPAGHMTDYFADNAIAAIRANANRPFFLYLAFNAPHTPLQATRADYDALPQIRDHRTRVYGAMVRQLDRRIGDVMAELERQGIADNTLVIFTSDNGGAWYAGIPDLNAPFRGWKASFYEGGIRVPLFLRWPDGLTAGSERPDVTGHIDLFATIARVAGAALPGGRTIDSRDMLAAHDRDRPLYWRSGAYRVVRDGDWKLQIITRPDRVRLYNLRADPTEQHDLAAQEPARVAAMRAMIERQNRGMAQPLWPGLIEAPVRLDVPMNVPWRADQDYIYWTN